MQQQLKPSQVTFNKQLKCTTTS